MDKTGRRVPFRMNWAQDQFYRNLHHRNIILKARQFGFTTLSCIYLLDVCLFTRGVRAGQIAHNKEDARIFFRDKIVFGYDNLDAALRSARPTRRKESGEILIAHSGGSEASGIRVGTSLRSGTFQAIHISELGKIAAKYPDKALEIKTGALNAISAGGVVIIESTAEGREGLFYEMCQLARQHQLSGRRLGIMDYRFHFFPWWRHPDYTIAVDDFECPERLNEYFSRLSVDHGIELSPEQRAWYCFKEKEQGDEMKREYPSTPDEAFEQSIEGAYYASQLEQAARDGRIGSVSYDSDFAVDTFWDLGIRDEMTIWFIQTAGREIRVIDYYECTDSGLEDVAEVLRDKPYSYGRHVAPHDIRVRELSTGKSRLEVAAQLGIQFEIAPGLPLMDGINAARAIMKYCWFDAAKCEQGLKGLQMYRKEWDAKNGVWKNKPRHDLASHRADSFRIMAVSHEFSSKERSSNRRSAYNEAVDYKAWT